MWQDKTKFFFRTTGKYHTLNEHTSFAAKSPACGVSIREPDAGPFSEEKSLRRALSRQMGGYRRGQHGGYEAHGHGGQ
jgi:hypothetical protein